MGKADLVGVADIGTDGDDVIVGVGALAVTDGVCDNVDPGDDKLVGDVVGVCGGDLVRVGVGVPVRVEPDFVLDAVVERGLLLDDGVPLDVADAVALGVTTAVPVAVAAAVPLDVAVAVPVAVVAAVPLDVAVAVVLGVTAAVPLVVAVVVLLVVTVAELAAVVVDEPLGVCVTDVLDVVVTVLVAVAGTVVLAVMDDVIAGVTAADDEAVAVPDGRGTRRLLSSMYLLDGGSD